MSDFDKELRQLIKEDFDRSLAGWTFTPAMRQAVLDRVTREGEPEATPVSTLPRRLRPAYWVAAAAAAFVLAFNLWPRVASDGPSSGYAPGMASRGAPESAPPAQDPLPEPTGGSELHVLMTAPTGSETGDAAIDPASADAADFDTDHGTAPEAGGEAGPGTVALAPVKLVLRASDLAAPAEETRVSAMTAHITDTSGRELGDPQAEGEPVVRMMGASAPEPLDLNPLPNGNVVVYYSTSVQVVDAHGATVYEAPLEQAPAMVAFGPSGESALVTAGAVARFTAEGERAGSIQVDEMPALVTVSRDRTALAYANTVEVYHADDRVLALEGLRPHAMALAPDGALALLTGSPPDARLLLYDADGELLLDRPVAPDGEGFGFLADGRNVAVGSAVYDRAGQSLWRFPIAPARISALADGEDVLAWNLQQAALVKADDGTARWAAEVEAGSILQASGPARGDGVVLLTSDEEGAALWVIDESGTKRHSERLSDVPVDAAVSGEQLLLLTAEGLKVRPLGALDPLD